MRKSAVSVRLEAGMPDHMAAERNAEGEEKMRYKEEKEGTDQAQGQCDPVYVITYIWSDTREG